MREITTHIKSIIEGNPVALATIDKDGKPYVIAITCYKVIGKDKLLLCDTYMENTLNNIKNNNNVALVAWSKDYEGYQFFGKAEYYKEGKLFHLCKELKAKKGLPCKGALLIKVDKITRSKNKGRSAKG